MSAQDCGNGSSTTGKVAIVTGASQGIGLEVTRALLRSGYAVVATARRASSTEALAPAPKLAVVDGDIGEAATAERVVREARGRFDRLDLLVNNAGIFIRRRRRAHREHR